MILCMILLGYPLGMDRGPGSYFSKVRSDRSYETIVRLELPVKVVVAPWGGLLVAPGS